MKTTSIRLTDDEEAILTRLAEKMNCRSRYGATSGQPSWRVMLQHLAEGRLKISNPLDKSRAVFVNFKRPPGWWKPDADGSMPAADVAAKYKTTVEILEEKGFVVDGDRIFAGNWKGWRDVAATTSSKATNQHPEEAIFEAQAARRIELAKTPTPDWFVRCPGMMAMVLEDAVEASGMERDEMEANGMIIRCISGCDVVSGPAGSEWAYEVEVES